MMNTLWLWLGKRGAWGKRKKEKKGGRGGKKERGKRRGRGKKEEGEKREEKERRKKKGEGGEKGKRGRGEGAGKEENLGEKGEGGGEMSLRDTISLAFGDGRCFWPQKAKWGLLIGRDAGRHQAGSTSGKENLLSLRENIRLRRRCIPRSYFLVHCSFPISKVPRPRVQ